MKVHLHLMRICRSSCPIPFFTAISSANRELSAHANVPYGFFPSLARVIEHFPMTDHPFAAEGRTTVGEGSRFRGSNGRFRSLNQSSASLEQIRREKERRKQLREFGEGLFELFLDVMFLPGSTEDFVIAQSGFGPIPYIVKNLFKSKYRVCPLTQSRLTMFRYFNGARRTACGLPRMNIFASDDPTRKKYRRRVYRGRRHPKVSRQTAEIQPLRDWIRLAKSRNAILVSEEEAYEIVRCSLETHTTVNGQGSYAGYPISEPSSGEEGSASASNDQI